MNSTDKPEIPFLEMALEPIDAPAPDNAVAFKIHPNTRTKTDRRVTADRRVELRFEDDRRSGKNRRPKSSWEIGRNL